MIVPDLVKAVIEGRLKATPAKTRYRVVDLDKVKTVEDIVLILKASSAFHELKSAEGPEWDALDHLLSDEVFEE